MAELDDFANDIARRCQRVQDTHDGRVPGVWSTGEQLAVAVVLRDRAHLDAMGYTPLEAAVSVRDRMVNPPTDINAWLNAIRAEIGLVQAPAPDAEVSSSVPLTIDVEVELSRWQAESTDPSVAGGIVDLVVSIVAHAARVRAAGAALSVSLAAVPAARARPAYELVTILLTVMVTESRWRATTDDDKRSDLAQEVRAYVAATLAGANRLTAAGSAITTTLITQNTAEATP